METKTIFCDFGIPTAQMPAKSEVEENATNLTAESDSDPPSSYAFDRTEYNDDEGFLLYPTVVVVIVVTFYVVVIIIGAVGNVIVIFVVVRRSAMRTPTNVLIANLAFADVFVCSFALPVSLHHQLTADWVFGSAMCRVIPTVYGVVVCASTLTLTAIAVDRYILIVYPTATKISTRAAVLLVFAIAVSSVSVALPMAVFSRHRVVVDAELRLARRVCIERWPTREARRTYTVLTLVVQYVGPLLLIAFLYSRIFRRVRNRIASRGEGGRRRRRRARTNVMLVAVVAVFFVAWTPYQLFSAVFEFRRGLVTGRYFVLGDLLLRAIAMSSSCINPFLYGWLNENFRSAFVEILRRFLPKGGKSSSHSVGKAEEKGSEQRPRKSGNRTTQRTNGDDYDLATGSKKYGVQWTTRLTSGPEVIVRHELTTLSRPQKKLSDIINPSERKPVDDEQFL